MAFNQYPLLQQKSLDTPAVAGFYPVLSRRAGKSLVILNHIPTFDQNKPHEKYYPLPSYYLFY